MAKRKVSRRGSSKDRSTKKPWHICGNCIDPLADRLHEIVTKWNYRGTDPPFPRTIEYLYSEVDLDFAIVWLKLCESVAFAKDFEEMLFGPLRQFRALHFRACQILDGDLEGTSTEVIGRRNAITTLLDQRYAFLCELPDEERDAARENDRVLNEIEDPYSEIEHKFLDTVRYLWRVSVVLRARIERRNVQRQEIPRDEMIEWSKLIGYKDLRTALQISHNALKARLVEGTEATPGKIRFERSGPKARKIQVAIKDLPAEVQPRFRRARKPS